MNIDLQNYIQSVPHILMIKTSEEERLIEELHKVLPDSLNIWNPTMGMMTSAKYVDEWDSMTHPIDKESVNMHTALVNAYKTKAMQVRDHYDPIYFMFLDADRHLTDPHIQRRIKNIAVASSFNDVVARTVILVSQTGHVPQSLEPYVVLHDFDNPSEDLIKEVLLGMESLAQKYIPDLTIPQGRDGDEIPSDFLSACRGLTIYQIKQTVVQMLLINRKVSTKDMQDFRKTIIKKTNLLDLMETDITFKDIAGLDRLKERLREVGMAWTPEGREYGVPVSRGLLQLGVPGCGKSLIAKALANEMGVTFIKFDPSNLFSSRVGDSEQNMRTALQYIEAAAPAIVFIDEIEKGLAGIQSSSYSDSGTTARVIGTFLSWFQDHTEDIFIIATANSIANLPPELISRFEEKYFVGMPGLQAREECFRIQVDKYWRPVMGKKEDLDFNAVAQASNNLTGREIEQVVCDAIRKAFASDKKLLTTNILLEAVRNKPPLILTMQDQIEELLGWVGFDPVRKEGIRARYASEEDLTDVDMAYSSEEDSENNRFSRMVRKDVLN